MRKILCTLCLLWIALSVFAEKIDSIRALKVANTFFSQGKTNKLKSLPSLISKLTILPVASSLKDFEAKELNNFYIINNSEGGFVIISGNNNVPPVLGYSMNEKIESDKMPPALLEWLQWREKEITYAGENNVVQSSAISQEWDNLLNEKNTNVTIAAQITPLIKTKWNQGTYYNALCPPQNPTGCVATAMAQILKYWEFPVSGTGSHSYTPKVHPEYGILSANFGTTTYLWAHMPNAVTSANNDVATLMYHCGVSVDMNYDKDGSSAGTATMLSSLKTYFNYKNTIAVQAKSTLTDQAWVSLISTELNNNRPVILTGVNSISGGGHMYICDGYNSSNYFHINWGWGGSYDGYFLFTALTPGSSNYSNSQSVISGIEPNTNSLAVDSYRLSLTSASGSNNKFRIVSNTSWKVSDNQDWLIVSDSSGTGCGNVTVTANSDNNTGADRTASISISVSGLMSKIITVTQVAAISQLPNLTPYKPSAWGDKIVVSNITGTSVDNMVTDNDILYVDYSFNNNGNKKTEDVYYAKLFLDDVEINEVAVTSALEPNYYRYYTDINIGILKAGPHILKLSVDPGGQITESNETDNIYTRTFSVAVAESIMSVSSTNINIAASANSTSSFSVTSNTSWTVSADQTWLTVSPVSGSNNAVVIVTALQNTSTINGRTAKVTISGTGVTKKLVTVFQSAAKLPNLIPYKPSTWSDILLVSNISNATTDATLTTTDNALISYAYLNSGNWRTEGTFTNALYLDNVLIHTKVRTDSLKAGYFSTWNSLNIGKLKAGAHTLKFSVDYTNLLGESDETDNDYSKTFTVSSTVGISTESLDDQINLYPNPVSDKLYIKNSSDKVKRVLILDINGKIWLSKQLSDMDFELNLSLLPSGCYIIVIKSNEHVLTRKLVKL